MDVIVTMGVSGSGKSTLGRALADALRCPFEEGDDLHPPANIARMRAGIPLDDADRAPWLDAVAAWIAGRIERGETGVISCSALKHAYRDRLRRAGGARLAFVLLDPDEATLRRRLAHRTGHFMPPSLLASQLEALERPSADERALLLRGTDDLAANRDAVIAWLDRRSQSPIR